jgi:hypothetical protein
MQVGEALGRPKDVCPVFQIQNRVDVKQTAGVLPDDFTQALGIIAPDFSEFQQNRADKSRFVALGFISMG